ncbi:MAG: ferrous iron transport protein B [Planctomycetia bacterium]|nr:ferrous iron transport protein B [Planctomycetia bacterium]
MSRQKIQIALAGNPNCGKSTLFNQLTGSRQHVGNYPGVTIERVEGSRVYKGREFHIIDLPGIYGMEAATDEEILAGQVLDDERPDWVVNVVDASNLERNLFLTLELLERGFPLLLVLNMNDLAEGQGLRIDRHRLSEELNVPVVTTVGYDGKSVAAILDCIIAHDEIVSGRPGVNQGLVESCHGTESDETARACARYAAVDELCRKVVSRTEFDRVSASERLDRIFLHRVWGIPLFLLMMYVVFQMTFTLGQYPMDWLEHGFSSLGTWINDLYAGRPESLLRSFLVDGILGGVGGVLVFLPNILLLFFAIAILEDSGYMARAAFLMNRLLTGVGLQGKSFIPMLLGFGCSVPAIMATRTLENRQSRLTTIFIIPLMSCGARLPIYTLIIPAFFAPSWQAPVLWIVYVTGIVLALFLAKVLRGTIFKEGETSLLLELPCYHYPSPRNIVCQTSRQGWQYLKKAGTIILGISICLWFLATYPSLPREVRLEYEQRRCEILSQEPGAEQSGQLELLDREEQESELAASALGRLGHALTPVVGPMGFDWRIGTALLGAIAAKEVFVSQLGIVYKVEGDKESGALRAALAKSHTPLTGICILMFCLVGMPCMATFAVVAKETGSWRFALTQWLSLTALAWLITTIVYCVGTLIMTG